MKPPQSTSMDAQQPTAVVHPLPLPTADDGAPSSPQQFNVLLPVSLHVTFSIKWLSYMMKLALEPLQVSYLFLSSGKLLELQPGRALSTMEISFEKECPKRGGGLPHSSREGFYKKMKQIVVLIEARLKNGEEEDAGVEEVEVGVVQEVGAEVEVVVGGEGVGEVDKTDYAKYAAGVIWNSEGLILTVAHSVPKNHAGIYYRLIHDTEFSEVEVVAKDDARDLAILRPKAKREPMNFLKLADWNDVINPGTEIFSICHPDLIFFTYEIGYVSHNCIFSDRKRGAMDYATCVTKTYRGRIVADVADSFDLEFGGVLEGYDPNLRIIQIEDFNGDRGSSGGPIFDCQGKLIGLIGFRYLGYSFGIHFQEVKEFVKNNLKEFDGGKGETGGRSGGEEKKQRRGNEGKGKRKKKRYEAAVEERKRQSIRM
ncbi:hypothetical protein Vadar_034768 [Vaccinium darrowii]|uniref:Uncharacterized protein n=1 Tax=Vaccinium darrowii TaxID=229202 RepID=A0ACB7YJ76_9ERIC|nr:hypothetical protein Vadar_034768 [Vaccinium darrowii]